MSGDILWRHSDPRGGLFPSVVQALERSARREWETEHSTSSKGTRVADLRALALASAFLQARFSRVREVYSNDGHTVRIPAPDGFTTDERQRVAGTLSNVWGTLAPLGAGEPRVTKFATHGDGGIEAQEAGNPWLIGVAIVASGVFAYAGHQVITQAVQTAGDIVDRQLARMEDRRRLMELNGAMTTALGIHAKKEETAGKELPLTEAERAQLEALQAQAMAVQKKQDGALVDRRAPEGGLPWGLIAVGGLLAFTLTRSGGHG